MRIRATDLHGALINGVIQNKTTDGDYEVDMKQVNGVMVSEPILLVSVGDDDVTFNGKGTDNGKNDQTLLADFGSKIIVTFPEAGNVEATFQAQQPIALVTLDIVYCHPLVTGATPITSIPEDMMGLINKQTLLIQEIYRQIGFKVDGITADKILTFPAEWLVANNNANPPDPLNNLSSAETAVLRNRVHFNSAASTSIRVGFVNAKLTSSNGGSAKGLAYAVGSDPALVSLHTTAREDYYILAHEVGHVLGRPHNITYGDPDKDKHWLMCENGGLHWGTFDSSAPIRWHKDDAGAMKTKTAKYVKTP